MREQKIFDYLSQHQLHSTLLITGKNSSQRKVLSQKMAQRLFCKTTTSSNPCGTCSSCRRIINQIHPDVFWVEEEELIKIERVRELSSEMEISPLEGGKKLAIILDCDKLNISSANAFLKTLEEPWDNRFFWLFTDKPFSLPVTLRSRCLKFSLPREEEVFTEQDKSSLADKKDFQKHVIYLQKKVRDQIIKEDSSETIYSRLNHFDELVLLEEKLRSNANYQLLIEAYFKKYE